jgi:predicted ATPase
MEVTVSNLPTGTVTFLFTDIEGSTRLLHELGDRYADALAEHRRVLREAFARHGGLEVDTQGDAFFVAFGRASDALAAAREAQATLDGVVRVRMGVHTGEPLLTEEGYVGLDVHRAARIASAGHGGQVLVSQSTRDLVGDGLRDLGEHRLKDLTAPERIYQLGDGDFPPLKSLNQTNLPVQPTPLVGRERELADLIELVRSHSLVTLTGAGGSGKTRLALQAAAELVDHFADGAWFVSLASLTDASLVEPAIASVIGAKDELAEFVNGKEMLLVLDNLEQLLPGVSTVVAGLQVNAMATSRERLSVYGEQEYQVPTLPLDDAVTLFTERARLLKPAFEPDEHVSTIARRLDGLPLALELAAARVKVLTTEQIVERLGHSLDLLTSGSRDMPTRQRTLRATIQWSYELLGEEERRLFARLAVFAGSFDLEAAEAVCDADLDAVGSLIDKSLLRETGDGRFFVLETIRDFALEQLQDLPEAVDVRRRHAQFFTALGARLQPQLEGGQDESSALDRLERELPNLRAARNFLQDEDADSELELATATSEMFRLHGHAAEGRAWLEDALGRTDRSHAARPDALEKVAYLAYQCHDLDAAEEYVGELRQLADSAGSGVAKGKALHLASIFALGRGETAEATRLEEKAVELLANHPYEPYAHNNLAYLALLREDTVASRRHAHRALELSAQSHEHAAGPLALLALTALMEDDTAEAGRAICENVRHESALGFTPYFALQSIPILAAIAAAHSDWKTSGELLGALDAHLGRTGGRLGPLFQQLHESTLSALESRGGKEASDALEAGSTLSDDDLRGRAVSYASTVA